VVRDAFSVQGGNAVSWKVRLESNYNYGTALRSG
jgi:hypothetical protein